MHISNPRDIAKSCVKLFKNDPNTGNNYIMIFIKPGESIAFNKNRTLVHILNGERVRFLEKVNEARQIDSLPSIISIFIIYTIESRGFGIRAYDVNANIFYGCNEIRIKHKFDIIYQIKKLEFDIIKANENYELLDAIKSKTEQIEKIKELNKTLKFHQYKFNDIIVKTLEQKYVPPPRTESVPKIKSPQTPQQGPRRGTRNRKEPDRLTYTAFGKNKFGIIKFTLDELINDPFYFNCNSESSLIEALLKLYKQLKKEFNEIMSSYHLKNVKNMDINQLFILDDRLQTELDRVSQETRAKMAYIEKEHNEQVKLSNVLRLATKYNKKTFKHI